MCHPISDVLSIPLVLPSPGFPFPPMDVMTQPLQVYTRCPNPSIEPFADSSSMPQSSPTPVSQSLDDLPIAIRKGTRSTSNPYLVYNFLSFHRLSLPYFSFVSSLSFVLPLKALVRLSLIRAGNRQWLRKWMLFTPMAHGNLSLVIMTSLPLIFVEFIQ